MSEVSLIAGFLDSQSDRQAQLHRKTAATKTPARKETPGTPSQKARPFPPNPVTLQYRPPGLVHISGIHQCSEATPGIAVGLVGCGRVPEVDILVHSNTSGEQECVSAENVWISIKGS